MKRRNTKTRERENEELDDDRPAGPRKRPTGTCERCDRPGKEGALQSLSWEWQRLGLTPPVLCGPCAEHFVIMLQDLLHEQCMERRLSLLAFVNVEDAEDDWSI